jgi:hypothetical protein
MADRAADVPGLRRAWVVRSAICYSDAMKSSMGIATSVS